MEAFKFFNNPSRLARNLHYNPEATVEFNAIDRPLSDNELELSHSISPDQLVIEGLERAVGIQITHHKHRHIFPIDDGYGMGV
jgi:hypothetical protein